MKRLLLLLCAVFLFSSAATFGQEPEIDNIVAGIYVRDSVVDDAITDMSMTALVYSRKLDGDGSIKEEDRFYKTYYFKDSLYKVDYAEYVLPGSDVTPDEEAKLQKKAAERAKEARKRRKKGRARDANIDALRPFAPGVRSYYRYALVGIEELDGLPCYHVTAQTDSQDVTFYVGDWWFETESLNPVYARFTSSKLPSKMSIFDMEMNWMPTSTGYWLPGRFYVHGKGQVLILIKFHFEGEEIFSDYKINQGYPDSFFREEED
jgi:hypothetical protein